MKELLITLLLVLVLPGFTYMMVKAARMGWLKADWKFYEETFNGDKARKREEEEGVGEGKGRDA